jgi:hypothetical protein
MAQSYNKTSNFVSEVLSRGIAKPNRYEVSIDTPVCISNPNLTRLVNLFCDQALLPLTRVITSRQQIFGPPSYFPVGIDYGGDNLNLQFLVDRNMQVKQFFDSWVNGIINRDTYTANYRRNYATKIRIDQLDESDKIMYRVELEDAYPVVISPLTLDSGLNNTVHKLSVTFTYRRWKQISVPDSFGSDGTGTTRNNPISIQNGSIRYNNNFNIYGSYNPALNGNTGGSKVGADADPRLNAYYLNR